MKAVVWGLFLCGLSFAQAPDPSMVFEVASIKVAPPPEASPIGRVAMRMGCTGGPGTQSPGQYTCMNSPVSVLISQAFGLRAYQYPAVASGDGPRYNVSAKIPAGATKEQVQTMFKNLLIERFKLAYHFEKREMPVYDLVVGKNGSKLKPSPEQPAPPPDGAPRGPAGGAGGAPPGLARPTIGPDGFPVIPAGRNSSSMFMMPNGGTRLTTSDSSMEQLVNMLTNQIGRPVVDATGLKGKYDYTLTFTRENLNANGPMAMVGAGGTGEAPPPPPSDAPSIFSAVQDQLGLKLEQKKGAIDFFVMDHVEKNPIEN
ncbi:MAG: TIGR03435 family protein [Candidatus Solibacter sp.]